MREILRLVLLLVFAMLVKSQSNYCSICSDHTLCQYPGPSPTCQRSIYDHKLNDTDKAYIVHLHNLKRELVASGKEARGDPGPQPSASNMNMLVWDDEVASIAQRWADQCTFAHDSCRNTATYGWVGQNIAMSYGSPYNQVQDGWDVPVDMWYDEVQDFDKDGVSSYTFSSDTGHYSEVVWGNVRTVGCGFSSWDDGSGSVFKPMLFVCNYGPGGNWGGEPVYSKGPARASCTNSPQNSNYPSLCGQ